MNEEDVEALIHGQEDSSGNINYEDFVKMVLAAQISVASYKKYDIQKSICSN